MEGGPDSPGTSPAPRGTRPHTQSCMHLLGQPPLETRVTQMNCIFNVPSPASGPQGAPPGPPWRGPGPGPNPPVLEPRAVDRSSLWGGVPAPPSFDLSALLGSPGNPCKPAPRPLHPRASQLSSNFGQSVDARSSEAHGGLGEGDTGFARTRGVRRRSQPSLRAPGGSPRPVRTPCLNRPRPAFSLLSCVFRPHSSSSIPLSSTLLKRCPLPVRHRSCLPGGLAGWARLGCVHGDPASWGWDPPWGLPSCFAEKSIKTSVLTLLQLHSLLLKDKANQTILLPQAPNQILDTNLLAS